MVVPRRAVSELQGRFQVYVVGADNKVEVREVGRGPVTDDTVVISSGLQGGETVVVEGVQKVRSGMTVAPSPVKPKAEAAPAAAGT